MNNIYKHVTNKEFSTPDTNTCKKYGSLNIRYKNNTKNNDF